jgi:O-antigen/teichoic acid export membrane protein
MILVRMLTQSEYGTYQQIVLVTTAVSGLLVLGLPTSVFYFYKHIPPERVPALVMQTTLMLAAAGLVAGLGIFFSAGEISEGLNNPDMTFVMALSAISLGFVIASEHCMSFLITQNRYGLAVVFESGETLARVLIMVAPLLLGYGFTGLIIGGVVFSVMRFIVRNVYLYTRSDLDFTNWQQHTFVRDQLAYSIPIAVVPLVAMIGNTFNRGLLATSLTPADYAVFAVGSVVFPFATIFQTAVSNVLRAEMPQLVKDGNYAEISRIMREAVRKLSIIVLPSFVFLFAHSQQFMTVLFTEKYAESVSVFRIFLWELPLDMLILSAIPQIFGKTKINMYVNFAGTAVLLILSFVLIKLFGIHGAAAAGVATQYFTVITFFVVVMRLTHGTVTSMLPLLGMLRVVAASLVAAFASHWSPEISSVGLFNLLAAAAVYSVVWLVVAALIGVFTEDDRRLIRRWVAKVLPAGAT